MKPEAFLFALIGTCQAMAQTIEGTSNSVPIEVVKPKENEGNITLQTLGITKVPKYYALIVGVSEYKNAGPNLQNLDMPAKDAERLASLLVDKYTFDPNDVTLLKNPTREDLINELEQLDDKITNKDNLLIFYAGHGFYDKDKDFGYWLPSDAKIDSRSAWIANSTVKDYVGGINSKHTLLITDACFGGSIFKTRSVDAIIMQFNQMYKNNSRKAMTSGSLTEVPDKSIFLKYLIKSLDENSDVFLSASKLFNRMYEPITNNTSTLPQMGVIQGAGDEGGDFIFIKRK